MQAAEYGYTSIVKALIAGGADIEAGDDNPTPLMYAAEKGDTATVKALINSGANVNVKHISGHTALE